MPAQSASPRRQHLLLSRSALVAAALCLPAGATQADQCDFFDVAANEFVQAGCSVSFEGNSEIMTIGKKRVVFVQAERQGQWATGTLNGKPAMRYEINREEFSYAAGDLKLFVSRSR